MPEKKEPKNQEFPKVKINKEDLIKNKISKVKNWQIIDTSSTSMIKKSKDNNLSKR